MSYWKFIAVEYYEANHLLGLNMILLDYDWQNKENYIQDLLTAKTSIAAQSDRLLSHYRSQIAQYEAEVRWHFVVVSYFIFVQLILVDIELLSVYLFVTLQFPNMQWLY